jgi:hypothetical protein
MAQLAFGWDTIVGLGTYVLFSFLFNEPANVWFLVWAGFCAYLPDLDLVYFIFQSKEVRKWGHWRYGFHHPLFFIPIVGVATWFGSTHWFPAHAHFLTSVAVTCVFGHFVHDSTGVGLHWFSPITRDWKISFNPLRWMNIRVTPHGLHILSQAEVEKRYAETARKSQDGGAKDEIETRIEKVTRAQLISITGCLVGLVLLFLQ